MFTWKHAFFVALAFGLISIALNIAFWARFRENYKIIAPANKAYIDASLRSLEAQMNQVQNQQKGTVDSGLNIKSNVGVPVGTNTYVLLRGAGGNEYAAFRPIHIAHSHDDLMEYEWYYFGDGKRLLTKGSGEVYRKRQIEQLPDGKFTVQDFETKILIRIHDISVMWDYRGDDYIFFNPHQVWLSIWNGNSAEKIDFFSPNVRWCTNSTGYHLLRQLMEQKELPPSVMELLKKTTVSSERVNQ